MEREYVWKRYQGPRTQVTSSPTIGRSQTQLSIYSRCQFADLKFNTELRGGVRIMIVLRRFLAGLDSWVGSPAISLGAPKQRGVMGAGTGLHNFISICICISMVA